MADEKTQEQKDQEAAGAKKSPQAAPQRQVARSSARVVVEAASERLAANMEDAETTDDLSMPEFGVVFTPGYPAPPKPLRGVLRGDRPLIHMGGGRYEPDSVDILSDVIPFDQKKAEGAE